MTIGIRHVKVAATEDSLEGDADDVAQDDHGGGGQAGSDLLANKVVQGGVGGDLGVLPRALAHHVDGYSTQSEIQECSCNNVGVLSCALAHHVNGCRGQANVHA